MVAIMRGVVKDGKIIPDRPLPEGETVAIGMLPIGSTVISDELEAELNAWCRSSGDALAAFEASLDDGVEHATR